MHKKFHFILSLDSVWFIELWVCPNKVNVFVSHFLLNRIVLSYTANFGDIKESMINMIKKCRDVQCAISYSTHLKLKHNLLFDSRFIFRIEVKAKIYT